MFYRKYIDRWRGVDATLRLFIIGMMFFGINNGILTTSFNNYIHDLFQLDASGRGFLEFPREAPGLALVLLTGVLAGLSMRFWSVSIGIISALGVAGLAWFSPGLALMTLWMILWSLADHLFMPVEGTVGLILSKEGKAGRRLGQLAGARNFAMILGALLVWLAALFFQKLALYRVVYSIAALAGILAAVTFYRLRLSRELHSGTRRFVFRRQYTLYYLLNIIFGARKQIFLTFAPWLLITRYDASPGYMAMLIMIASVAGVVFRQYFGLVTDRFGERAVFIADALILMGICAGFAFVPYLPVLSAIYILDNLMFSVRIAKTTYLNRIAVAKTDIPATISLGISMDHAVSMTMPMLGGMIWIAYGPRYLFLGASGLAVLGLIVALRVRPRRLIGTA